LALATASVSFLFVGTACNGGPDNCDYCGSYFTFQVEARGANVTPVPATGWANSDTLAEAPAWLVPNPSDSTVHVVYAVTAAPTGTIDSVLIFAANASASINDATPSAVLCNSAATCDGDVMSTKLATFNALWTSMRGYGAQLVFVTTTHPKIQGGAIRGVIRPTP
jgi:hypothetical protein